MEQKAIWKLEFLLESMRDTKKIMKNISETCNENPEEFVRGQGSGIRNMIEANERHLKKLDSIVKEIQGYLQDDVDLSGGEEIA